MHWGQSVVAKPHTPICKLQDLVPGPQPGQQSQSNQNSGFQPVKGERSGASPGELPAHLIPPSLTVYAEFWVVFTPSLPIPTSGGSRGYPEQF